MGRHCAIERLGNASRYACEGVAVTSQWDGIAYRVLVWLGIKESDDRFRYRSLARDIESIGRSDVIHPAIQIVPEPLPYLLSDLLFVVHCPCEKDCKSGCLRSFDPFRMVVWYIGCLFRLVKNLFFCGKCETYGADTHCRTISPSVVWLRIMTMEPLNKWTSISSTGITQANLPDRFDIWTTSKNRIGNGNSQDAVVREPAAGIEERKVFRLDGAVLINWANDISGDRSDHIFFSSVERWSHRQQGNKASVKAKFNKKICLKTTFFPSFEDLRKMAIEKYPGYEHIRSRTTLISFCL